MHSNVDKRIRFYTEVMYNWATFMHYIPVQYEVGKNFAGCITVAENRKKCGFYLGCGRLWSPFGPRHCSQIIDYRLAKYL